MSCTTAPTRKALPGAAVQVRVSPAPAEAPATSSSGVLLTFVVGARQAAPWLDAAVRALALGEADPTGAVHLVRVVHAPAEVSPRALPGVSRGTLALLDAAAERTAARKEARAAGTAGEGDGGDGQDGGEGEGREEGEDGGEEVERAECGVGEDGREVVVGWEACVARAGAARDAGNTIVSGVVDLSGKGRKRLRQALSHYQCALHWNRRAAAAGFEETEARGFAAKVLGNVALVLGKLDDWRAVLVFCDAVLEIEPGNAKAVFRRGQAYARLRMFVAAGRELGRAAEMRPEDAATRREVAACRRDTVALLRATRKDFSEVYNYMCKSPIYDVVREEDERTRDTGTVAGFSRGFMG